MGASVNSITKEAPRSYSEEFLPPSPVGSRPKVIRSQYYTAVKPLTQAFKCEQDCECDEHASMPSYLSDWTVRVSKAKAR